MIEVIHRGYTIRFNENSDEWACHDAGYYSSPKLSNVKQRIDKMLLDERKKSALPCFEIGGAYHRQAKKTEAKIIEFVKTRVERDYSNRQKPPQHIVASVAQRSGSEKASRREVDISDLMPDTPEAHAAFVRFEEACAREQEAHEATTDAFNAIPRVTLDMIPALVRIAQAKPEEGSAS